MEAYALFLLGLTMGIVGLTYVMFKARKNRPHEAMLGTAMAIIGWVMGIIGGIMVVLR